LVSEGGLNIKDKSKKKATDRMAAEVRLAFRKVGDGD